MARAGLAEAGFDRAALAAQVQLDCDIADARHAQEASLCNYLLQMREFFRWQQRLPLGTALPRSEVAAWIAEQESRWDSLADAAFEPLRLAPRGPAIDPFDAEAINAVLLPRGLVYGAGLVAGRRPVFFLAELHRRGEAEGLDVLACGAELARSLLAPPAALAGGTRGPVLLRRESMARWGWERCEGFAARPVAGSAVEAMLRHYGMDRDFHAALPRWLDDQCETALLHEIGEHRVGRRLGEDWHALVSALPDARAAATAVALRDQLADLEVTLPRLIERGAHGPLLAWFAAHEGLRQALAPELDDAGRAWRRGAGSAGLLDAMAGARQRLAALADELLAAWGECSIEAAERGQRCGQQLAQAVSGAALAGTLRRSHRPQPAPG